MIDIAVLLVDVALPARLVPEGAINFSVVVVTNSVSAGKLCFLPRPRFFCTSLTEGSVGDGALSLIGLTSSGFGRGGDPGVSGMLIRRFGVRFQGVSDPVVSIEGRRGFCLILKDDGSLYKDDHQPPVIGPQT